MIYGRRRLRAHRDRSVRENTFAIKAAPRTFGLVMTTLANFAQIGQRLGIDFTGAPIRAA